MGKHAEQIRSLAEPRLVGGERVIETVLANYNGSVPATTLPGGATRSDDPDAQVTFPSARQMALALTDQRLVVLNLGFSGKPKSHIGDVPLSAIDEVGTADTRLSGVVRLTLRSGAKVDLEILRGEPTEHFVDELQRRVTPAPAAPSGPDLPSWDAPLEGDDLAANPHATGDLPLPPPIVGLVPLSELPDEPTTSPDLPPSPRPDLPPPPG